MAEPEVVKPEGDVVVDTPDVVNEEPQYTEEEQRALNSGWIPLDQWKGDPKDHRDARAFNDRGELLGKLKSQGSQIKEMSDMLRHLGQHNARIYEASYRDAINSLQHAKVQAIRDGEVEQALAIDAKIDEQKDALQTVKRESAQNLQQKGPSQEFQQWSGKNEWFTKDTAMRYWAVGSAQEYVRVNPTATEDEVYRFIDTEVRKEFPQRFQRKAAPSPDGSGRQASQASGGGTKGSDEFEKLIATFPEDEQRAARNIVKMNIGVTKESYVKDYNNAGRR